MGNHIIVVDHETRDFLKNLMLKDWSRSFAYAHEYFDAIFDIGAYCGGYSIIARAFNPKSKIIALEPGQETFKILKTNVEGLNIETCMVALGTGKTGVMTTQSTSVRNQFRESEETCQEGIPSMLLSDIVSTHVGSMIDKKICIKINCEGAEKHVFDHEPSLKILDSTDLILMECHGRHLAKQFKHLSLNRFAKSHVFQQIKTKHSWNFDFRLVSKRLAPRFKDEINII